MKSIVAVVSNSSQPLHGVRLKTVKPVPGGSMDFNIIFKSNSSSPVSFKPTVRGRGITPSETEEVRSPTVKVGTSKNPPRPNQKGTYFQKR